MKTNISKTKEILEQLLPPHEVIYCDVESHDVLGLNFKAAGVAIKLESGQEVYGASSSEKDDPLIFAGYECLERFVIQGLPKEDKFQSVDFKWSLSNGIALHDTYEEACENSYGELFERSEILKSWYFNTPVRIIPQDMEAFSSELATHYEIIVADFSTDPKRHAIGYFALPKNSKVHLVYGFGSSSDLQKAILKAKKEFITRLGFLWGEEVSESEVPKNTPDFHQEFYLKPENGHHIREWLFGTKFGKKEYLGFQLKDVSYVNITPAEWQGKFYVTKATSKDCIPLFFGMAPQHIFDFPYRCDIPHPIV